MKQKKIIVKDICIFLKILIKQLNQKNKSNNRIKKRNKKNMQS
jgi:hypothetical protein